MVTEQLLLNHYVAAMNNLKSVEDKAEEQFKRSIETLRGLKSGEIALDSIVVTDNGWEIMPAPPVEKPKNEKKAEAA